MRGYAVNVGQRNAKTAHASGQTEHFSLKVIDGTAEQSW